MEIKHESENCVNITDIKDGNVRMVRLSFNDDKTYFNLFLNGSSICNELELGLSKEQGEVLRSKLKSYLKDDIKRELYFINTLFDKYELHNKAVNDLIKSFHVQKDHN